MKFASYEKIVLTQIPVERLDDLKDDEQYTLHPVQGTIQEGVQMKFARVKTYVKRVEPVILYAANILDNFGFVSGTLRNGKKTITEYTSFEQAKKSRKMFHSRTLELRFQGNLAQLHTIGLHIWDKAWYSVFSLEPPQTPVGSSVVRSYVALYNSLNNATAKKCAQQQGSVPNIPQTSLDRTFDDKNAALKAAIKKQK